MTPEPGTLWRPRVVGPDGRPSQAAVEVVEVEGDAFVTYRFTDAGADAPNHQVLLVQWLDYFEHFT